jgi:hypothetical protein
MIEFNNGFVIIERNWTDFKKLIDGTEKKIRVQYELSDIAYHLYGIDDKIVYRYDILLEGKEPIDWTQEQTVVNATARAEFIGGWIAYFNKQIMMFDNDGGGLRTVVEPPAGSKLQLISVNWCDPCTWFYNSIKVVDEVLQDSGDGYTFISANKHWIDLSHGRVSYEDDVILESNGDYMPIISVDGVAATATETDGGFATIDYDKGWVIFNEDKSGKIIKATYWYGKSSIFILKPNPGKKIKILQVEVQFSKNIQLMDSMYYQPYGYAGVFAPQLGLPQTQLIPLTTPIVYKRITDYINEANGALPIIPAISSNTWRGTKDEMIIFQWKYLARTDLHASYGMELRVGLIDDTPHIGEHSVATFYGVSEDE